MRLLKDIEGSRRRQRIALAAAFLGLILIWITKICTPSSFPFRYFVPREDTSEKTTRLSPIIKQNVAAIVEGRPIESIAPLVLHFASVLGPEWPVFIFTHENATIPKSAPFQRALHSKAVNIVSLPAGMDFKDRDQVSDFFTSPWFWEELAPAKHVLLFQSDSIICSNYPFSIDKFLKYDFIGAPVHPRLGFEGLNGGLSLRNRTLFLDITRTNSWKKDVGNSINPYDPKVKYEDQWYFHRLRETINRTDKGPSARLPTPEEAGKFSVESWYFQKPFGFHQINRYQHGDRLKEIDDYCPEWRLASTEVIKS